MAKHASDITLKSQLELVVGCSCVVVGGSSLTSLSSKGEVEKHHFYPTSVEEYINGIVDAALQYGRLEKSKPGVLMVAAPGAFQNEGTIACLPPNFHRVQEDARQRGMPNLFFRSLVEEELQKRGFDQVKAYGYNDAVPALVATLTQPNTEEVLTEFEEELASKERSDYAVAYMINGTGTGEAAIYPDSHRIVTAEKGHLKPNFLWYELNPFFKYITRLPIVGQNRSIERLIAGGPHRREIRHFTKILNAVLDLLVLEEHPDQAGLVRALGYPSIGALRKADTPSGLLKIHLTQKKEASNLGIGHLSDGIKSNSDLAVRLRNIFARAVGSAFAYMHFAIGEMPDTPLNTFIGPNDIRCSALGFIRSDGSTTALLGGDPKVWEILEHGAQDYSKAMLDGTPHLFRVKEINHTFPDIHPDFGGLPALAAAKLEKFRK
ncbi:MAG: hypothetical protein SFT81_05980 [Candidatus Caenarcaniphilales bacterium]|nr:hypothetical protein [Candidatus Caenarcaniphilales bacterium]